MTPATKKIDVAEYYAMGARGAFAERTVELIDGEVIDKPMQGHDHVLSVENTRDLLIQLFGRGCWVRAQYPLELGLSSVPEPDVSVSPGPKSSYRSHPTTAILVVEVSDTTLASDRSRKASLYAAAGIRDYWIVNLDDRLLEVHRDPVPEVATDFGFTYASVVSLTESDSVTPLALPGVRVKVSDLLPER